MKLTFFDLWENVSSWSLATFGSREERGGAGALKHMVKEIATELFGFPNKWYERTSLESFVKNARPTEANQMTDVSEYADLLILLIDSAQRQGFTAYQLIEAAQIKMGVNRARNYPRPVGDAISEHDRSKDVPAILRRRLADHDSTWREMARTEEAA